MICSGFTIPNLDKSQNAYLRTHFRFDMLGKGRGGRRCGGFRDEQEDAPSTSGSVVRLHLAVISITEADADPGREGVVRLHLAVISIKDN